MDAQPFSFREQDARNEATICVPLGIFDKRALLRFIAKELNFPDYFGENWDALEECLRDLSWRPAGQVVMDHEDLPLINDIANARAYVAILANTTFQTSKSDRPVCVVFPISFRDRILWLLRLNGD